MSDMCADMSEFSYSSGCAMTVKAGHAAVFQFPSIKSQLAPSVTWQFDDNTLLYGNKYANTADNKLVFLSMDSSDQKKYRYGPL